MPADDRQTKTAVARPNRRAWVLIIPFIAMVIPQLFNYREPSISGVPFFYWYLLLWIPLTAVLTWIAYRR